jgi:nonribosomal peptide synthetase MxcG
VRDGELWIAGPGLFIGYRNLPDLTAARLVQQDRLWYRTGDLVREHPDGGIEFVGRMDRQVKIRGMLVSPEEIEARLAEHPDVRRAAVTANGTLTAHVATALVPSEARSRLRTHLVQSLPDWMIPQHWVFSNSLPETLSGKPVTTTEERLATLWCRILHLPGVSRTDRFKDLGGDSLKAIDLVVAAHAEGLPLGPDQVCGTLEQMAAAIDSPSAVPAEALRRDVAFSADFESLLDDAAARPLRSDPGATLVTGATGFLGSHLAARLPKNVYRLTLSPITPFDIPGDMSEPRMGLSSADWHRLTGEVDTIFHCAAGVNLVRSYADLRPTNVAGTQELLRFMATGRPKRLHHASSLSVFVTTDRSPGLMLESDTLDETGLVYGGYGQSKWAAEVMLRQSGHRAGPISYYRFGLLTGPVAPTDWLARFARGTVAVGCLPQEAAGLAFDMTPIDYAADAMVWLSRQPAGTWHVANAESATLADLAKALRAHGYPIEWVSPEVWATRAPAPMQAALGFRQGHEKQRPLDLFAATGMEFDTTLTTAALQGSGIAPLPPARELLHAYLGDVL